MSLTLTLKDNGGNPVSGEGTSITLNNTIETNFTKFDLYGDTTQQTYSGKNLYEGSPDFSGTWNNEASWTTSSQTYNGMVVKQRTDAWAGLSKDIPVVAGKTYTFSLWAKADTARTSALYIGGGGATATVSTTGKDINLTTSWQRYFLSFSVSASGNARPRLENKTTLGTNAYICGYQLEENNSMTDYEPYVGGTASPNPDYPQEVQTVTGRQVVTISDGGSESQEYEINLGKNLLNEATMESGSFNYLNGGLFANATFIRSQQIPCEPNTTYSFSSNSNLGEFAVVYYASDKTTVVPGEGYLANYRTTLFTSPASAYYMRVKVGGSANPRTTDGDYDLQIEKGSSATTYAPYFTPIELCKIGTYQDYIYKSGEDWYVHKETDSLSLAVADMNNSDGYPGWRGLGKLTTQFGSGINEPFARHSSFYTNISGFVNQNPSAPNTTGVALNTYGGNNGLIFLYASNYGLTQTQWKTNYPDLIFKMYYGLPSTAHTDTQITNSALIAQLEALYTTAHAYNGATIVTSSSQYLPAIMDVTIGASTNEVTYTETELSNPLTITDIEGKSQNTTLNGNIYVDYVYNKKSFSVSIFNLKAADYATIRGFYDRQFTLNEFPLLSIPELNISEMPVFFEIGSREINSQCIVTDKLTLKFRETAQQ